jgi:hypothetical protein
VSAPATLVFAQGRYVPPWSSEWESAFGQIVSQAATRYGWDKAWERLPARELEQYNHQVYLSARQVLLQHPGAWLASHAQGMLRYFEPQTYRVCYARFCGREWPPDILEDAIIHVTRQIGHAQWAKAGEIISQQRWHRLTPLQGAIWWGTFGGQIIGLYLMLRGAWKLRHHPILLTALLLAIFGLLWVPGPIAYERFRVPVMTWILALVGVSTVVQPPARPALRGARI